MLEPTDSKSGGVSNPGFTEDESRDEAGPLPAPNIMEKRRKKSSFLGVEGFSEMNAHTYVYDANKDFEGMTVSIAQKLIA